MMKGPQFPELCLEGFDLEASRFRIALAAVAPSSRFGARDSMDQSRAGPSVRTLEAHVDRED